MSKWNIIWCSKATNLQEILCHKHTDNSHFELEVKLLYVLEQKGD